MKAFAEQGAKVFITYYREVCRYSEEELKQARESGVGGDVLYRAMQQRSADELVSQIRSKGGAAVAHKADLANPDNIPVLFDLCETELGG